MKGTANVPGIGGSKNVPTKPADIGAQEKLAGTEGQYVGFNEKNEAVPMDPLTGNEEQYIGFDAEGKQIVRDLPKGDGTATQAKLTGTEGQYVGFNESGEAVAKDPLAGTENQYIGFDENGNQVVKDFPKEEDNGDDTVVAFATSFYGTIGTEWTEDEETGVKSQFVEIEGVLAAHHMGIVDVVMTHERTTEGYAEFVEETNQFLQYITNGDAETVDGGIMFYIYGDPNTVTIPFGMVVS